MIWPFKKREENNIKKYYKRRRKIRDLLINEIHLWEEFLGRVDDVQNRGYTVERVGDTRTYKSRAFTGFIKSDSMAAIHLLVRVKNQMGGELKAHRDYEMGTSGLKEGCYVVRDTITCVSYLNSTEKILRAVLRRIEYMIERYFKHEKDEGVVVYNEEFPEYARRQSFEAFFSMVFEEKKRLDQILATHKLVKSLLLEQLKEDEERARGLNEIFGGLHSEKYWRYYYGG